MHNTHQPIPFNHSCVAYHYGVVLSFALNFLFQILSNNKYSHFYLNSFLRILQNTIASNLHSAIHVFIDIFTCSQLHSAISEYFLPTFQHKYALFLAFCSVLIFYENHISFLLFHPSLLLNLFEHATFYTICILMTFISKKLT
jgi:hypothetical protein